jgi:hypothetical protein
MDKSKILESCENFFFIKRWEYSLKYSRSSNQLPIRHVFPVVKKVFLNNIFYCLLPILLLLFNFYTFSKYTYIYIYIYIYKKKSGNDKKKISRLFINTNGLEIAIDKNILKAGDYVLNFPQVKSNRRSQLINTINIVDIISFRDIIYTLNQSIGNISNIYKNYGYWGLVYGFNLFDMLIFSRALNNLSIDIEIITSSQKDRWAYIIDNAKQKSKSIIQHGTNYMSGIPPQYHLEFVIYDKVNNIYYLNMPNKLNTFTRLFAFNKKEAHYLILGEHSSTIRDIIYIGYNIKFTQIEISPENRSILIIGNNKYYFQEECEVIDTLYTERYILLLKPHPLSNVKLYAGLAKKYNVDIIEKKSFYPNVDYIISYKSTLANEYEDSGFRVIYYEDIYINGRIDKNKIHNLLN